MKNINIFSIRIDNVTLDKAATSVIEMADDKVTFDFVVTPNVDHVVKLQADVEFKKIYDKASLVLADGQPLIWASRILRKPLVEKVSGSDLFPKICEKSVQHRLKIFLVGGNDGVALQASKRLIKKYPGLNIVGTYSPPRGFEKDNNENDKIIRLIHKASPDILFVGLGAPKQEKWIYDNLYRLRVPVSLGVGASFDFEAGNIKRAPKVLQKIGMEWFWRFCHEPTRLFRRYFIDDIKFIRLFFKEFKGRKYSHSEKI
ncbi:WecB/TagA/CpsF family glycosyltransferase [Sporolactobacillus sp. Y61]|uniref:WecB/TagA/CpsF family glycosyltransferase n=1 Tax=Sporolactobacillus sp. Y61 TaxID=3160863 RepID=A0AAU8IIA9_9BACL